MGWHHCCGGRGDGGEDRDGAWPKEPGGLAITGSWEEGAAPRRGKKDPGTLLSWVLGEPEAICSLGWPFRGTPAKPSWPALPVGSLTLSHGAGITGRMVGLWGCKASPLCPRGAFVTGSAEVQGEMQREERLRGWREAKGKWEGWRGGGDSEVRLMLGMTGLWLGQAGGEEPGTVGSSEAECLCKSCGGSLPLPGHRKEDFRVSSGTAGGEGTALAWGGGKEEAPEAGRGDWC